MGIRILLADDHTILRQGLRSILEEEGFQIVAECGNGQEAVRLAEKFSPEVAIMDIGMPILNGIDAMKEITRASQGRTRTILLTMHTEDSFVLSSLRAGARGYLIKSRAAEDLVNAIKDVNRGEIYLSPGISETVVQAFLNGTVQPAEPLSDRERQVLQLLAEGKRTKEIAVILGISTNTAESHRNHIMEKLDIHDIAGLVRYALRHGLVQD